MGYKESFLQYLQIEKRYSSHTVRSYMNDLGQFQLFLSEEGLADGLAAVTSNDIRAWIVSLLDNKYSTVSVHRKISCLRVFYRYLRKEGLVKGDPLEKVVLPRKKKRLPAFVEEGAMERLLDEYDFGDDFPGIRNRAIIEMLYMTGMRRSELIGLRDIDLDLEGGTVKVSGKRNKQRIIPLLKSLTSSLEEYISKRDKNIENVAGGWFFVSDKGNKLYDKFVYNVVTNYLAMVTTIEKKSPHILRQIGRAHV